MNEGIVEKTVQRSNLLLLVLAVLGVIGVLVIAALNARYLYNFVKGPFPISQSEVLQLSAPQDRLQYFVTVNGEDVLDTGYQYVTTLENGTERVDQYYLAMRLGERWMLIRSTNGELVNQYTGALITMPADEQTEIISNLESEIPALKGVFLPVLLDVNDFRKDGYWGVGLGAVVLVISIILAILALKRSNDPLSHPIMKALAVYGDPNMVSAQLNNEMSLGSQKIGPATLTSSWIILSKWSELKAVRIQDVVWIYKNVVQHRTNGIPTGKFYYAVINDMHGKTLSIQAKQAVVDEILQALVSRTPWAVKGFSSELAALWRKNREGFINEVNRRKTNVIPN